MFQLLLQGANFLADDWSGGMSMTLNVQITRVSGHTMLCQPGSSIGAGSSASNTASGNLDLTIAATSATAASDVSFSLAPFDLQFWHADPIRIETPTASQCPAEPSNPVGPPPANFPGNITVTGITAKTLAIRVPKEATAGNSADYCYWIQVEKLPATRPPTLTWLHPKIKNTNQMGLVPDRKHFKLGLWIFGGVVLLALAQFLLADSDER